MVLKKELWKKLSNVIIYSIMKNSRIFGGIARN